MMEFGSTEATAGIFRVTARPNGVGMAGLPVAVALLLPCCIFAAIAFISLGAWPVAVFMLLPLLGLCFAFFCVRRHAADFERLTLRGDQLLVERHTPRGDEHLEFNSQWVQVALYPRGLGRHLVLRCHGKEVPFGLLLTDDERTRLAAELAHRLAQMRH
jgi:uncharacterized membrane protein